MIGARAGVCHKAGRVDHHGRRVAGKEISTGTFQLVNLGGSGAAVALRRSKVRTELPRYVARRRDVRTAILSSLTTMGLEDDQQGAFELMHEGKSIRTVSTSKTRLPEQEDVMEDL